MVLFDAHAHYDDDVFDADRSELLSSLPGAGIGYVVNAGADEASSKASVKLAKEYSFVYATVGVHPHSAAKVTPSYLDVLEKLSKEEKVVAIGEIGLDYHYDFSPRDVQKKVFDAQLSLAEQLSLPVVIHEREAIADTLDILAARPNIKALFHCYSGSVETAKTLLKRDNYFSFGGVITFKNAVKAPEVVAFLPNDRLLLETDCPYLTPVPHRGKRNNSRYLSFIAEKAAMLRNVDVLALSEQTTQNALEFYNIKA